MPIERGKNRTINQPSGTVPDVSSALLDWFQPMQFENVTKGTLGFQLIETGVVTKFRGMIQPLTNKQLQQKPQGQRAWTWLMLNAERVLKLDIDDMLTYRGVATRVMALKDFSDFGFMYYELVQNWTVSDPLT